MEAITAKAVIICTGGLGRLFAFTTNASIKTGDGMALAYRAGGACVTSPSGVSSKAALASATGGSFKTLEGRAPKPEFLQNRILRQ